MNKEELLTSITKKIKSTKVEVKKFLEGYIETVTKALKKSGIIQLLGFGILSTTERRTRTEQNPRTKEKIQIPASKAVKFSASKQLKEDINF